MQQRAQAKSGRKGTCPAPGGPRARRVSGHVGTEHPRGRPVEAWLYTQVQTEGHCSRAPGQQDPHFGHSTSKALGQLRTPAPRGQGSGRAVLSEGPARSASEATASRAVTPHSEPTPTARIKIRAAPSAPSGLGPAWGPGACVPHKLPPALGKREVPSQPQAAGPQLPPPTPTGVGGGTEAWALSSPHTTGSWHHHQTRSGWTGTGRREGPASWAREDQRTQDKHGDPHSRRPQTNSLSQAHAEFSGTTCRP